MAESLADILNGKSPAINAALLGLFSSRLPVQATADPEADPPVPGWDTAKKVSWIVGDWLLLQDCRWRKARAKDEHVDPITKNESLVDSVS